MFKAKFHITKLKFLITYFTSLPQYYCLLYSIQPLTADLHFKIQFILMIYSLSKILWVWI